MRDTSDIRWPRKQQKRERRACHGPDRPPPLVGGDLLVRPGVPFALRECLDAEAGIIAPPTVVYGKAHEDTQLLQPVVGRAGRRRTLCNNALDMLTRHFRDQSVPNMLVMDQSLNDKGVCPLRPRCEAQVLGT
jgi:hypothetical protein